MREKLKLVLGKHYSLREIDWLIELLTDKYCTKQDVKNYLDKIPVLRDLDCLRGCWVPVRETDVNGANENYSMYEVNLFFDEDMNYCLESDEWEFCGERKADAENTDIEIWAQEAEDGNIEALRRTVETGHMYIATFRHESEGCMEVMYWK